MLFLSCSSSSKILSSFKFPAEETSEDQNLAILAFFPSQSNRALVENALETEMRARDIKANATYTTFPLAGNKQIFRDMGLGPEEIKDLVREKVNENGIDAFMTISLLDATQEERYKQGSNFTMVGAPIYRSTYPEYGYGFYDYYAYAYSTSFSSGYYETTTTYFLELNLYDIATEQLIWTCQTSTKDPESVQKEAPKFAKLVVDDMIRLDVLQ